MDLAALNTWEGRQRSGVKMTAWFIIFVLYPDVLKIDLIDCQDRSGRRTKEKGSLVVVVKSGSGLLLGSNMDRTIIN